MNAKDKMLKEVRHEQKRLEEMITLLDNIPVNLIEEMFPQGNWWVYFGNTPTFELPLSFQLIDEFEKAMAENFPDFEKYKDNQHIWGEDKRAGRFLGYNKKSDDDLWIHFDVDFRSEQAGATCILNPIGKKTKEVIEYEIVCSEQAAQEFTLEES